MKGSFLYLPSIKLHYLRVYYQTMTWMNVATEMNSANLGCKVDGNEFIPVMRDMNAARDTFMKTVHYNCKTG